MNLIASMQDHIHFVGIRSLVLDILHLWRFTAECHNRYNMKAHTHQIQDLLLCSLYTNQHFLKPSRYLLYQQYILEFHRFWRKHHHIGKFFCSSPIESGEQLPGVLYSLLSLQKIRSFIRVSGMLYSWYHKCSCSLMIKHILLMQKQQLQSLAFPDRAEKQVLHR